MSNAAVAEPSTVSRRPVGPPDVGDGRAVGFVPLVQRLGKVFRAFTDIRLAEIGLTSGQDQLLDAMPQTGALSVSVVANELRVRASTVSKMIDRLAEKGLVRRVPDATDARLTLVGLTDAGRAVRVEVKRIWAALERELAGTSSRTDAARMEVLLELEALVEGRLARLR